MAASVLLKNTVSIEEWMVATKETKEHCTLKEKCFLRLNTVTCKKKLNKIFISWNQLIKYSCVSGITLSDDRDRRKNSHSITVLSCCRTYLTLLYKPLPP